MSAKFGWDTEHNGKSDVIKIKPKIENRALTDLKGPFRLRRGRYIYN